jgi:hypothetical protein
MLKQKLRKTNSSSKAHLIEKTLNVWNNDSELKNMCTALINSMPQRVCDVLKIRGNVIGY